MPQAWVFAAILLLAGAPALDGPAEADRTTLDAAGPCAVTPERTVCEWEWLVTPELDVNGGRVRLYVHAVELPVFALELATVTLRTDATTGYWFYTLAEQNETGPITYNGTRWSVLTSATSNNDFLQARDTSRSSLSHLIAADLSRDHVFMLQVAPPHPASYHVRYEAVPVPEGEAPARPAATLDDPHLAGSIGDSASGATDLTAAWMDDADLGDGLFELHVAVRDLSDVGQPSAPSVTLVYEWSYFIEVGDAWYEVNWVRRFANDASAGYLGGPPEECRFVRHDADPTSSEVAVGTAIGTPLCAFDNATSQLHATLPESAIGSPAVGALLHSVQARALTYEERETRPVFGGVAGYAAARQPDDALEMERFPFALGGPDVWCEHRKASCVPTLAWYEAPLRPENQADTLQFVAALFAIGAFVVGAVLVRRRRARVKALFEEVDAVVRAHPVDTRAGLLALGMLESDFDARYRSGKLHENEYQLASQRIATAATRLSLRRDLGLDDGVPGDEPHARGVRR